MIKLNSNEIAELASAWIERHEIIKKFGLESKEAKQTFPVYMALEDLVSLAPENAWNVIIKIFDETNDEYVLSNLAAGPLETFLGRYGNEFIDRIEILASTDLRFKYLLAGVWKGMMSDDLWARIRKVSAETEG